MIFLHENLGECLIDTNQQNPLILTSLNKFPTALHSLNNVFSYP
jgi:hypothetical protein